MTMPVRVIATLPPLSPVALGGGSMQAVDRIDAFPPAGELDAHAANASSDGCRASCVHWYGNARPILTVDRTFALMGYELVEGRIRKGRIREVGRLDFAPRPALRN